MNNAQRLQKAKEKAQEIRKLIWSQPPEVIMYLAETFTMDDEGTNQCGDYHDDGEVPREGEAGDGT